MVDPFCGGIKASNYRHVQRIYELEDISEDEKKIDTPMI